VTAAQRRAQTQTPKTERGMDLKFDTVTSRTFLSIYWDTGATQTRCVRATRRNRKVRSGATAWAALWT